MRSYPDVNCANCHRPGGSAPPPWDSRAHLTLALTNLMNGNATQNASSSPATRRQHRAAHRVDKRAPVAADLHAMAHREFRQRHLPHAHAHAAREPRTAASKSKPRSTCKRGACGTCPATTPSPRPAARSHSQGRAYSSASSGAKTDPDSFATLRTHSPPAGGRKRAGRRD